MPKQSAKLRKPKLSLPQRKVLQVPQQPPVECCRRFTDIISQNETGTLGYMFLTQLHSPSAYNNIADSSARSHPDWQDVVWRSVCWQDKAGQRPSCVIPAHPSKWDLLDPNHTIAESRRK
jgi:hypothetical protein